LIHFYKRQKSLFHNANVRIRFAEGYSQVVKIKERKHFLSE